MGIFFSKKRIKGKSNNENYTMLLEDYNGINMKEFGLDGSNLNINNSNNKSEYNDNIIQILKNINERINTLDCNLNDKIDYKQKIINNKIYTINEQINFHSDLQLLIKMIKYY